MTASSRSPVLWTLLLLCSLALALPAWAADAPAVPSLSSGRCAAAPMCVDADAPAVPAPPAEGVAPEGVAPEEVPFENLSPVLPDSPPEPLLRSIIGDCCTGGVSQCAKVSHYSVHCGGPQCETGEYSCLYNYCPSCP